MRHPSFFRTLSVGLALVALLVALAHRAQSQETAPTPAAQKETILLQSIGALSASFLYQTNMIIGMVGDARAKGVYDDATANAVLENAIRMCGVVDKHWEAVHGCGLEKGDMDYVAAMGHVGDLLKKQGEELKSFWTTGKDEHGQAFTQIREEATQKINELLGIK